MILGGPKFVVQILPSSFEFSIEFSEPVDKTENLIKKSI